MAQLRLRAKVRRSKQEERSKTRAKTGGTQTVKLRGIIFTRLKPDTIRAAFASDSVTLTKLNGKWVVSSNKRRNCAAGLQFATRALESIPGQWK